MAPAGGPGGPRGMVLSGMHQKREGPLPLCWKHQTPTSFLPLARAGSEGKMEQGCFCTTLSFCSEHPLTSPKQK